MLSLAEKCQGWLTAGSILGCLFKCLPESSRTPLRLEAMGLSREGGGSYCRILWDMTGLLCKAVLQGRAWAGSPVDRPCVLPLHTCVPKLGFPLKFPGDQSFPACCFLVPINESKTARREQQSLSDYVLLISRVKLIAVDQLQRDFSLASVLSLLLQS